MHPFLVGGWNVAYKREVCVLSTDLCQQAQQALARPTPRSCGRVRRDVARDGQASHDDER